MRWTRPALTTKVAALEDKLDGDELVDAVVSFADTLEPEDRALLQEVLLDRADEQHVLRLALHRKGKGRR